MQPRLERYNERYLRNSPHLNMLGLFSRYLLFLSKHHYSK